jgi:hypothetical protein
LDGQIAQCAQCAEKEKLKNLEKERKIACLLNALHIKFSATMKAASHLMLADAEKILRENL